MKEHYIKKLAAANFKLHAIDEKIIKTARRIANKQNAKVDDLVEKLDLCREERDSLKSDIAFYKQMIKEIDERIEDEQSRKSEATD